MDLSKYQIKEILGALLSRALPTNPRLASYIGDPSESFFIKHFRQDVTANDASILVSAGTYRIASFQAPTNQVLIIKAMIPYAMERTDVGGVTESAQYIDPLLGNDWLWFTPLAGKNSPLLLSLDLNAPQNMAGPTNTFRQRGNAIAQISATPYFDAVQSFQNPFFIMKVPSGQKMEVLFSLAGPAAGTNPISNPFVIGVDPMPLGGTKRVDFAGVFIAGLQIPETAYVDFAEKFKL